jgi:hypothetical protein
MGTHQGKPKVTGTQDAEPDDEERECAASGDDNTFRAQAILAPLVEV